MPNITVDFTKTLGPIKPIHATGQPPFAGKYLGIDFQPMEYLQKAHIPYCRLHDVQGAFGSCRYVDIPNIFRDFDADETDPANYDFAFTDALLEAMHHYGLKPIFRLGVTIENQCHIKPIWINPPEDPAKWARICEHIVRHYNEGWADGYHYGIEYWEIWNEPENGVQGQNQMWTGTPEQYFELYDVTAKHLKKCFGDTIKVGGYGACGFYGIFYDPQKYGVDLPPAEIDGKYEKWMHRLNFLFNFLAYIKEHQSPIDFFSWHSYYNVKKTVIQQRFVERTLKEYGYEGLETHMNEWNNAHKLKLVGSAYAAAGALAMLCALHDTDLYMGCYYDTRIFPFDYGGAFNPKTRKPTPLLYGFEAFGELYALGNQVECNCEAENLYTFAAVDGDKKAVLVVNYSEQDRDISLNVDSTFVPHLIDEEHLLEKVDLNPNAFTLKAYQIALFKNY